MKCSIKNVQLLIAVQLLIVNKAHSKPPHCVPLLYCDHILHLLEQKDSKNDTKVIGGLIDSCHLKMSAIVGEYSKFTFEKILNSKWNQEIYIFP